MVLQISNLSAQFDFAKSGLDLTKQDPYVVFQMSDSNKVQTKALKGAGASAVWQSTYELPTSGSGAEEVAVAVFNHNSIMPDNLIGSTSFSPSQVLNSGEGSTTLPLTNKKGSSTGQLSFTLSGDGMGSGQGMTDSSAMGMTDNSSGMGTGMAGAGIAGAGMAGTTDYSTSGANIGNGEDASLARDTAALNVNDTGSPLDNPEGGKYRSVPTDVTPELATKQAPAVCDEKFTTTMEQRPVTREEIEVMREHHPVQKEFTVETRATGREREVGAARTEVLSDETRIIGASKPSPCEGHPELLTDDVQGQVNSNLERIGQPEHYTREPATGGGWTQGFADRGAQEPVIDAKSFTTEEDRTIDLERRRQLVDQHTYEKEYKVQTGLVGEHEIKDRVQLEPIGADGRVTGVTETSVYDNAPRMHSTHTNTGPANTAETTGSGVTRGATQY